MDKKISSKLNIKQIEDTPDLVFHFIDPPLEVDLDPDFFDKKEQSRIKNLVKELKESIWIDKTYVAFKGSNYSDAFLQEAGWKSLCNLLVLSDFGKNLNEANQAQVIESYCAMLMCYMYEELGSKFGVTNHEHLFLKLDTSVELDVEVFLDETPSDLWAKYPGKWQTWESKV